MKLKPDNRIRIIGTAGKLHVGESNEIEIMYRARVTRAADRGFWVSARLYVPADALRSTGARRHK